MDLTYVDEKNLKTLEDYALFLTVGMMTLTTLQNIQVRAIKSGLLAEDMIERANTMIWDIRRQMGFYKDQLDAVLEVTGDFNAESLLKKLKESHMKQARSLLRKTKSK